MSARAVSLPAAHSDSGLYFAGSAGAMVLGLLGFEPLFLAGLAGAGLTYLAFRKPVRAVPQDGELVLAPLDGVVEEVRAGLAAPPELRLGEGAMQRVRLSSAPWDAGGVRAPAAGRIAGRVTTAADRFHVASSADSASAGRAFLTIESELGPIGLVLVTGGFGPRVALEADPDGLVEAGQEIAMRRFGGWCDLYLPASVAIVAVEGQRLIAGETPVAVAGEAEAPRVILR